MSAEPAEQDCFGGEGSARLIINLGVWVYGGDLIVLPDCQASQKKRKWVNCRSQAER